MVIPLAYAFLYKKEILKDLLALVLVMVLIVVLYEPLAWGLNFPYLGYIFWKFVLFVFLPIGIRSEPTI